MNDKTMLSMIFRNNLPRNPEKFRSLVEENLVKFFRFENYKHQEIEAYFKQMGDIIFSEKNDRKITGNLNRLYYELEFGNDWIDITPQFLKSNWANGNLRRMGKAYIEPSEEMEIELKTLKNKNVNVGGKIKEKNNRINKYYIISVKLNSDCYRHIKLPVDTTLEQFADTIIYSFDFMNDHAHAFFMDNISWSKEDCYYSTLIDEEDKYRHTSDYTLDVVEVGYEFRFIFDFGDEWTFQCKVLKEEEEETINYLEIIKTVGDSPEQYPNYDEFE